MQGLVYKAFDVKLGSDPADYEEGLLLNGEFMHTNHKFTLHNKDKTPRFTKQIGCLEFECPAYFITIYRHLKETLTPEVLAEVLTTKEQRWIVEYYSCLKYGVDTAIVCSHLSHVRHDVNPKNINLEPNNYNLFRGIHTACECKCTRRGVRGCIKRCKRSTCHTCSLGVVV